MPLLQLRSETQDPSKTTLAREVKYTVQLSPNEDSTRSGTQDDLRALHDAWKKSVGRSESGSDSRNFTVALMRLAVREALDRKVSPRDIQAMFDRAMNDEIVSTVAELNGLVSVLRDDLGVALLTVEAGSTIASSTPPSNPDELPDG